MTRVRSFYAFRSIFFLVLVWLGACSARAQSTAPEIDSFSPQSGSPGTAVDIKGEYFLGPLTVEFTGGAYATGTYKSTDIRVKVPDGAQTGPITVNAGGGTTTTKSSFVVPIIPSPVPVIISATTVSGMMDQPLTYQIQADRSVLSYSCNDLPAGLSLDPATGLISGIPEESGNLQATVSATDATGTGSATIGFNIADDIPVATVSAVMPRAAVAYRQTVKFIVRLSHAVPRDTGINYSVVCAPLADISFDSPPDPLIIPAGKTRLVVKLRDGIPLEHLPSGTVRKLKFKLSDEYPASFTAGSPSTATTKLVAP